MFKETSVSASDLVVPLVTFSAMIREEKVTNKKVESSLMT